MLYVFAYVHCNIHLECVMYICVHCSVYNAAPKGPFIVSNSRCVGLEKHTIRSNWEQHNSGAQRQESSSSYLSMGCCRRYVILDGSCTCL